MDRFTDAQKDAAKQLVQRAASGELRWLDQAIRECGYARVVKDSSATCLVSVLELQRGFAVSRQTLVAWRRDGMPVARQGGGRNPTLYDPVAVARWWFERRQAELKERFDADGDGGTYQEKLRREKWRAVKHENDRREGLLVEREVVRDALRAAGAEFRAEVENLSKAFGPEVDRELGSLVDKLLESWQKSAG